MAKTLKDFQDMAQDEVRSENEQYSEDNLFNKIKKCAKSAGVKVMYLVLLLYYSIPKLSSSERTMVFFALGYFIAPFDLFPDFFPGGFSDDFAALIAIGLLIKGSIDVGTKNKAKEWLKNQQIWGDKIDDELMSKGSSKYKDEFNSLI